MLTNLKRIAILGLAGILVAFTTLSTVGCNGADTATRAQNAVTAALNIAAAEVSVVPAADQAAYKSFVALGQSLNAQLGTCIAGVSGITGKAGKFLSCFNTFANGLLAPAELAQLRLLNPSTQAKVQLYVTAIVVGVNIAVAAFGGSVVATPSVGPAPASSELEPVLDSMHRAAYGY